MEQKSFIEKFDNIINLKKEGYNTEILESEIDRMVYKLYGLTDEEIRIVEESVGGK